MKKTLSCLVSCAICAAFTLALSSCDETDSYIAEQLRNRDWQGYIGAYYSDRWGISGDEYATVMRFTSRDSWYTSGRGEELDYSRYSRYDYAYCTFKWFIVDGEITLIYDDDKWNPIYIVDYRLNGSRFYGYIWDGTNRRIQFDLENVAYNDWGYYNCNRTGGYGTFSNQHYYHSREAQAFSEDEDGLITMKAEPLVIDRTEQVRQESGEPEAVSILSGIFAEKFMERAD
ncbi:MAG: hypothetical protein J6W19_00090 [Prevotella sp.]|nr:hypothetical protein [Prevotella sp.]